ncbi:hypothetical protein Rsub_05235 [Raphidocelis subcapitata]|uniref:Uncharacterized protein n=1 Tax=Raphidocelis subcapitata TaxID=307507 RepID=A0A2V0NYB0_9CHLO|nr:hypothetical protein Rsub_05235 [Raphidocelis subcapitata]|eukprot:GBF92621.1 hypothetical protein Rsub_05235 [Raphidocelis subcapitata]
MLSTAKYLTGGSACGRPPVPLARRPLPVAAPLARRAPRAPRFKERNGDGIDEQHILLPLDPTELLGLVGRDSYHLCDIMDVYDDLRADAPGEGFSAAVLAGRLEVLELVKDEAVYQGGRVAIADKGGMTIPVQLLPGALVLLTQIGAADMVINMALPLLENWEVRKAYKRDILLALALAYCSKARDLLTNEQTVEGCMALEEALHMLQSGGSPPLAPRIAGEIESALRGLAVPRVLDQLRAQASPELAAARKRAVALLRHMLHEPHAYLAQPAAAAPAAGGAAAAPAVNADYVRLVVGSMGAREIVDMADWRAVARNARTTFWVYPGLLQIAAHAHAAVGFLDRDPSLVQTAQALLRAVPGTPSAESLVLRAVCGVLLGATEEALAHLQAARRAPLDALLPWPTEAAVPASEEEDPVLSTGIPVAQESYGFVCAHSRDDESGDLLPGLCLLTELWLSRVGFAMFPDTEADALNCSLSTYFNNARVQQLIMRSEAVPAVAAGVVVNTFAAVAGGVQGLSGRAAAAVKAALSAPAAATATAAAPARGARPEPTGGGRGQWDGAGAGGGDAGGYPDQWPPSPIVRGAIDVAADAFEALPPPPPPRHGGAEWDRRGGQQAGAGDGWTEADAAEAANELGELRHRRGALPVEPEPWAAARPAAQQQPPWAAPLRALAAAAAAVMSRPAVAALVGGAALAACVLLSRDGSGAPLSAARAGGAAAASASAGLNSAAAARLVRGYQEARWAALGPDWDASALAAVADGQALAHLRSQSDQFSSRGWFQRFRLHGLSVNGVHPAGPGAARVEATLRESSSMYGVDGRRADSVTSEYDVVYRVRAGSDGRWRVTNFKVLGREPGGGVLGGLFGR